MRRFLAVALVTAGLVATSAASPALACGCGGVVAPDQAQVSTSSERAIVYWDGQRETIELTFDVKSDSPSIGLIIPTPFAPEISAGDPRTFDLIESIIAPQVSVEKDWWGLKYFVPEPEVKAPDELQRVSLGPLQATTLGAADTPRLSAWLASNGFLMSEEMTAAIRPYGDNGWAFTTITLSSAAAIDGHIDPIRLSFNTNTPIYPIRLARSEKTTQHIRMFVFDDNRNEIVHPTAPALPIEAEIKDLYAGKVSDSRLTVFGTYLSAFDITYTDPENQATSDLGFQAVPRDGDLVARAIDYRPVTLLGLPVGTLVVVWALIGLILVIAHFRGRRRAR